MQNCFIKFFKLQEFHIENVETKGKTMLITCRPKTKIAICKTCGRKIRTVHQYRSQKPRKVKHLFWDNHLIMLLVKTRVFFCWECKKSGRVGYTTVKNFNQFRHIATIRWLMLIR